MKLEVQTLRVVNLYLGRVVLTFFDWVFEEREIWGAWGARELEWVSRQNQPKAAANHRFIRNLIRNRNNNRLTITETQKEIATRKIDDISLSRK